MVRAQESQSQNIVQLPQAAPIIDADRPYINALGNEISELDYIRDFEMGFFYSVAVDNTGKPVILKQIR